MYGISLSTKAYYFVERNNDNCQEEIKSVNLNVFQQIARKIFGCYKQTHMSQPLAVSIKHVCNRTKEQNSNPRLEKICKLAEGMIATTFSVNS